MATLERLKSQEFDAPRRFSRWSPATWQAAVAGPAARLASSLGGLPADERLLEDYLTLVREAVGLQLVSLDDVRRLDPSHDAKLAIPPGFLATALFDVLPRFLPPALPADRARALARCWNVGERLVSKAPWLDRYLAARLREITTLAHFDDTLARLVTEGLEEGPPCPWKRIAGWTVVDPTELDGDFLPGAVVQLAPRIAVVRDRLRPSRALGLLLRPRVEGGPVWLGGMPADGAGPSWVPPGGLEQRLVRDTQEDDVGGVVALPSGFALVWMRLSQRLWVAEGA